MFYVNIFGSSAIWSDTFLRLELWRNVTQRNGEHRGLFITKLLLTQRHRWCVEKQRIFASFINTLVYFITKQWFARFIKTFITKAISNMYTTSLSLFVPSAPPWYCLLCFHLRVLPLSVWLLYVVGLLYHSKFLKNQKKALILPAKQGDKGLSISVVVR